MLALVVKDLDVLDRPVEVPVNEALPGITVGLPIDDSLLTPATRGPAERTAFIELPAQTISPYD